MSSSRWDTPLAQNKTAWAPYPAMLFLQLLRVLPACESSRVRSKLEGKADRILPLPTDLPRHLFYRCYLLLVTFPSLPFPIPRKPAGVGSSSYPSLPPSPPLPTALFDLPQPLQSKQCLFLQSCEVTEHAIGTLCFPGVLAKNS